MKYLRKHETADEFQTYSESQIENDRPNTSYVEEQSKVYFTDKDYLKEYLTFKSLGANGIGFRFGYSVSTGYTPYIEYSVNDGEWERITNRNNAEVIDSIQVNEGDTMYLWESAGNIGLGDMCDGYLVTRQNTFDGITMEDNINNRYHPYAMLSSDMSLWYSEDDLSGDYDYVFVKYEEY